MGERRRQGEAAATMEPIDSLTPWARNPRHNDEAVGPVADSIRRFGFASPIIARASDRVIIAGHTRWKAARSLGMTEVPVRFLDLSETEAHALALADNRLGEVATWDDAELSAILRDLERAGEPLDGLGWDGSELEALLADLEPPAKPADDEAPEVDERGEPDSKPGEVYELGPHRLWCGANDDSSIRSASTIGVRLVLTDPPYGISAATMTMGSGESSKPKTRRLAVSQDWDSEAPPVAWLIGISDNCIVWGGNYFRDLPTSDDWLVWHKKNDDRSFSEAELAWSNIGCRVRLLSHHWGGERKEHITQKPLAVMRWCLDLDGGSGTVLDPFGGSGTTLMACAERGRVCHIVEREPAYCDVIRRRWTRWADENGRDAGSGALR